LQNNEYSYRRDGGQLLDCTYTKKRLTNGLFVEVRAFYPRREKRGVKWLTHNEIKKKQLVGVD